MAEFRPIRRARAGGPDLSGFEGVHLTLRAGLEELTAAVGAWRPGDAAMEPAVAWPGHANAVSGDVRAQLERAADAEVH